MFIRRLLDFFTRSARREPGPSADEAELFFARRHHSFKLFLTAWNAAQEAMADLEYTLCCDHPFGLHRVQALCTRMATQVFQCIKQLERLDASQCQTLYARFDSLQKLVASDVYEPAACLLGPLVLPLRAEKTTAEDDPLCNGSVLVDPSTAMLERMSKEFPELIPQGFVITAAGCQHFFQNNDLQSEINRLIQATGGIAPKHLTRLSGKLTELVAKTPMPTDLVSGILGEVERLRQVYPADRWILTLRGRIWAPESMAEEAGGFVLWGPPARLHAADLEILQAIQTLLAYKQHAQALVYRRARGLTDEGAGACITCAVVAENCWGGLAQSSAPLVPDGELAYVYACEGLPQEMEYAALPRDCTRVRRAPPHEIATRAPAKKYSPVLDDGTAKRVAELALDAEKFFGLPQTVTWLRTPEGKFLLLMVRPMTRPQPYDAPPIPKTEALDDALLLEGGECACPGRVSGPAWVARRWEDVRRIPDGSILIVPTDSYIWGAVIDRAAGIVVEHGFQASRLASLAREFGKPTVLGMAWATEVVESGQRITLCADVCRVYEGNQDTLLPSRPAGRDYMPGSPVYRILQTASQHILPLSLEVDSLDFKAANCETYHDILRYCHEKAVGAMFSFGSEKKYAPQRIRQLWDQVPKQFWVVNLNDGFRTVPSGPLIDVADVTSRPLQALWHGMNAYPWQGPPPVDGKGFLSVLFEATANPNLDPASQTSYFTEKNYFLVSSDYCSMHSRFGFHFVSVEARLSSRTAENYLNFQLRGGAADIERRILRVRFVADILWEFGFAPVVRNDAVVAFVKELEPEEAEHMLAIAGYMSIHTRQLDMIMQDAAQVAARREEMLIHCRALLKGEPLPTPPSLSKEAC